ncbi:MAG: SpoIIE family protein phosphatase [Actinomycetota bacterium]|nr:SpoIIE family protein phosphatase [Actinomycetota bacterium]
MNPLSAATKRIGLRRGRQTRDAGGASLPDKAVVPETGGAQPVEIAPNDPVIAYFQSASGVVEIDSLQLSSPGADALRAAGVKMVVPLVAQGELIGLLNLGARLSEQDYSADDRKLLANLAAQAAPAVRVGQLVRDQEVEARSRERIEQELRVATLIQQQFLPKELPELGGWHVAAHYRPAREVSGDFYDFIELPDGRVGIVAGDVTDKGVPAALVMATTRSILRGEATHYLSPGQVLERVNDLLVPDIPAQMFVTCLYGVLDPSSGRLQYANAGHNLPYVSTEDGGVVELRARGMPLGLMPGMIYEEKEATLLPGQTVLLHSDGLAEAHNDDREMFGFPRVMTLMENTTGGDELIDVLLTELDRFRGTVAEQEDDITLVALQRSLDAGLRTDARDDLEHSTEVRGEPVGANGDYDPVSNDDDSSRVLDEFTLASEEGNERLVMQRVMEAVEELQLAGKRLERLKTAVAEATMNAIEHGNQNNADLPVSVRVVASDTDVSVQITDQGGDQQMPEAENPDIEAKLAGLQTPRGWGLFLIKNMVDDMQVTTGDRHHTLELTLHLKGDPDVNE